LDASVNDREELTASTECSSYISTEISPTIAEIIDGAARLEFNLKQRDFKIPPQKALSFQCEHKSTPANPAFSDSFIIIATFGSNTIPVNP
jgi:hypothetical protein